MVYFSSVVVANHHKLFYTRKVKGMGLAESIKTVTATSGDGAVYLRYSGDHLLTNGHSGLPPDS